MRHLISAAVLLLATACGTPATEPPAEAPASSKPLESSRTPRASATRTPAVSLPEGYDPKRNANADIAAALKAAKADHRPVLLDFGADWCPDCVVLGRTFRSAVVRPVIDGYHVVSIDVGQFDRNLKVAQRFGLNLNTSGIPALVVLSPTGKVKTTTNDGSFASARTMKAPQVKAFLERWK